jgi:hypothetical protein
MEPNGTEPTERLLDRIQSVLIKTSGDTDKMDMELVCGLCEKVLGDVEDGEYLEVLVAKADDHTMECEG